MESPSTEDAPSGEEPGSSSDDLVDSESNLVPDEGDNGDNEVNDETPVPTPPSTLASHSNEKGEDTIDVLTIDVTLPTGEKTSIFPFLEQFRV